MGQTQAAASLYHLLPLAQDAWPEVDPVARQVSLVGMDLGHCPMT